MKSLKRFSKRQKIVALSLCALSLCALVVILGVVVLINTSVYRQLDEANVNVIFSRDIFGGLFGGQSMTFPPKAIKQIYDSPEIVQVPSNFNQWELLLKVAAQMSPSGDYNIFDASYSRIDDASFLELLNNNALIHVKELKLVNCSKLSDESIGQICQMTNLRRMNLSSVNCSDESLTKLSSLPSLKRITIAKTQVTGECFNSEGWDALEILNLLILQPSSNFI